MSDQEEPHQYGLVMPFLPVTSKGGPYEDGAYVSGYEMGSLDSYLKWAKPSSWTATIHTDNLQQVDLIAMRHGYVVGYKFESALGWTSVTLTKVK